ncbi:hypothetical protein H8E88_08615 [candidate division KSB1 bacterium]|nr:hypothetical protein [candidate division KSB1 bacterium]
MNNINSEKMKKIYLPLLTLIVLITSCTSVLDNKIESSTIESNVQQIKEKYPELDTLKLEILESLVTFNKGREAYITELEEITKDSEYSFEKLIVSEETFNEQKDNLFNYLKAEEISFNRLLSEIDTVNAINDRFDIEAQGIYKKIDTYCIEKQKEIEEREEKAKEIKAKLNSMVDLKIISIRETEYDYRDVVEVKIQMTNKTSKPIEAISFNMEITDKLGNKLATLRCRSNDRFVKSDVGYWTYERWDQSDTYKALKNTKLSHISTKQEISKINHGGELISAYDNIDDLLVINYDYTTPEKLYGYCPYLEETDELKTELEKLKEKKEKEIEKSTPIINKYQTITSKLIDFSKMFD